MNVGDIIFNVVLSGFHCVFSLFLLSMMLKMLLKR